MEGRKHKLTTQLAKLNAQVLTSELPRSGSGFPLSPPRKKRPRISDFTSMLQGERIGLGSPMRTVVESRAVSGLIRVSEDDELPGMVGTMRVGAEIEVKVSTDDE